MVLSRSCSRAALATVTGAVLLLASPAVPGRAAATKPADKPTDAATEAKLDRPLPEVDFKGHALSDVIDFLRDVTRADISVDWKGLEAVGVRKDTPVTAPARMGGVKFRDGLKTVLDGLAGGKGKAGWTLRNGVIVVSAAADAKPRR